MFDGILPIYKDLGITSHDVVFKIRKILNMKKVGHSGTLDPEVDGVMLILLGNSTKVSDYAMDLGKKYRAEICLGIKTTTEDLTGEIIETQNVKNIDISYLKEKCKTLVGQIEQTPPIYSAVKVNGKKLYQYAREGNFNVNIPSRMVSIYSLDIVKDSCYYKDNCFYFSIDIHCGKGTYIRTIASQIGDMLNIPSCMSKLTRTASGKITIKDVLTIEQLEKLSKDEISLKILPKEYALEEYQFYELPKFRAKQVMNGLRFRLDQFPNYLDFNKGVVFTYLNEAIAIYFLKKDDDLLRVKTTFPKEI